MNRTTQHISPNPALDFANAVLEETDGAREIIYMLHDIAQGVRENATTNDRMKASGILMDRGLGKCPKQPPVTNPAPASEPDAKEPKADNTPDSPRLVTQLDRSLHDSLGPPPSAQPEGNTAASPESFDPYSIQQHILEITDGCRTLMTVLTDICRAPDDDSKACPEQRRRIKESHRVKAGQMLIDRLMGTNPALVQDLVCPDCHRKWTDHPDPDTHPEPSRVVGMTEEEPFDKEAWDDVIAKLKQLEEKHNLDPNRSITRHDYSNCWPPDDFDYTPYLQEADEFRAEIALRAERRKKWPEIEERRRKKLAQIYPSHSEDGPPET